MIPAPAVQRAFWGTLPGYEGQEFRDLVFLGNVQHQYLFCITTIERGYQNLYQLVGKRIGVPLRMESVWRDIEPMLLEGKPRGTRIIRAHENELFRMVQDNKIDAFFFGGSYPSSFLNGVVQSQIRFLFQFIPVMFKDEDAFVKRHYTYQKTVISLAHPYLPANYLPNGLGRIWSTLYTSEYWTMRYDLSLIATKRLDNFTGYEVAKTIFSSRSLLERPNNTGLASERERINASWFLRFNPLTPADITAPNLPELRVQEGAKLFYARKGMISYCGQPGCMQTIGVTRCVLCDKLIRETVLQWRVNLARERALPSPGAVVTFASVLRSER
jgi:hypothetical protein